MPALPILKEFVTLAQTSNAKNIRAKDLLTYDPTSPFAKQCDQWIKENNYIFDNPQPGLLSHLEKNRNNFSGL